MSAPRPLAIIVLDGLALNPNPAGNAVWAAGKPVLGELLLHHPHATLATSGEAVGLLAGQMGDSNVGHLNIGAGRVVDQYSLRITKEIRSGAFFNNDVLLEAMRRACETNRPLHLFGLVSHGGVHAHVDHLVALLQMAKQSGVGQVYVHVITDGRDVPPTSARADIAALEAKLAELGTGRIATVGGRYFAMDRDKRWERTKKAYAAMVLGEGLQAESAAQAVDAAYNRGETDEFITPTVITAGGVPVGQMRPADAAIFFNFRADRTRQLTRALADESFDGFARPDGALGMHLATMTRYEEDFPLPFAYAPVPLDNTLGEVAAGLGWKQLRIAETEKYAHVTFFFNGGRDEPFAGEVQRLVPSPKVATYDLKPEMSAYEVAGTAATELKTGDYDLMILNFANCDMVGHTGDYAAAVHAVETVDRCLGVVMSTLFELGGAALILADHGNADQMIDYESGGPYTYHTTYPVPLILASRDPAHAGMRLKDGALADVAPTLLDLAGVAKPPEMTGESLLVRPQ
ncbi:MAG TPA: 2,3-bisphosphoglycerate-independent phosphoglycerate mutase [Limnochordia bacterium]|nr:2,3-bisphosphoglycerate-independent phosphoglycerate mutase [Limnochordia bacterium]